MKGFVFIVLGICLISLVCAMDIEDKCEDAYFFIISNNYQYDEDDLNKSGITTEFLDNYTEDCYMQGYSDKLPKRPEKNKIIINKSLESCQFHAGNLLSITVPKEKKIYIGIGNVSCDFARKVNYFFRVEREETYAITGVRVFTLVLLTGINILIIFLTLSGKRRAR